MTYSVYRGSDDSSCPTPATGSRQGVAGTAPTSDARRAVRVPELLRRARRRRRAAATKTRISCGVGRPPPARSHDGTFATGAEIGDPPLDTLTRRRVAAAAASLRSMPAGILSTTRKHTGTRSFDSSDAANACITLESRRRPDRRHSRPSSPSGPSGIWRRPTTAASCRSPPTAAAPGPTLAARRRLPQHHHQQRQRLPGDAIGTPAFSSDNQFTWQQKSINLSAYAGQTRPPRLALRQRHARRPARAGTSTTSRSPTPRSRRCTSNLIFADGFATGTTGAWSAAVP